MIIFVSEKQVRANLRKYNIQSYDKAVFEKVNQTLFNFAHNELQKAVKKNKTGGKLVESHFQKGGRVVLPSEYFGVPSNHYSANAPMGTDMSVTAELIRPAHDIHGPLVGGASFTISERAMKAAITEALVSLNADMSVKGSVVSELKRKYESEMSKFMSNVQKKVTDGKLSDKCFMDVLQMKKYKQLQDQ